MALDRLQHGLLPRRHCRTIDRSTFEAARIDGANAFKTFWYVTVPQLKPMILLTAILSTNGTLQLFDESCNLTNGGPANTSMTMSHYLYNLSFRKNPNFGYAAAHLLRDPDHRGRPGRNPDEDR